MKLVSFVGCLLFYSLNVISQNNLIIKNDHSLGMTNRFKPPVDTASLFNWPEIADGVSISNDGQYAFYVIKNLPSGSRTLKIKYLYTNKELSLPHVSWAEFTESSNRALYMQGKDSLCLLSLPSGKKEYILGVRAFRLFREIKSEWLVCQLNNNDQTLMFRNLVSGEVRMYNYVSDYLISKFGNVLVLVQVIQGTQTRKKSNAIQCVDVSAGSMQEIWRGEQASNLVLSDNGQQLVFMAQDNSVLPTSGDYSKSVWHYKFGAAHAIKLDKNINWGINTNLTLTGLRRFSKNGHQLFISLKQNQLLKPKPNAVQVNIWSYTDAKLQSQQVMERKILGENLYLGVLSISDFRITRLQEYDEQPQDQSDEWMLMTYRKGDAYESYWNKTARSIISLVHVPDGKRKQLPLSNARFSPDQKFIVGYSNDGSRKHLFTYEIATGVLRNITEVLPVPLVENGNDLLFPKEDRGLRVAGWFQHDAGLLIYDYYDIWKLDPLGKNVPVKLSNGRSQKWQYRLTGDFYAMGKAIPSKEPLLVTAFNKQTKKSGFYWLLPGSTKISEKGYNGDYVFKMLRNNRGPGFAPKARDAEIYLVQRERCDEYPNLYQTNDFKNFIPISQLYPEKAFNWFNAELIEFPTSDSIVTQGILYKPENYDTSHKYPLIIHYYDKKSDELHQFHRPFVPNGGELDVAWFVSHGYLVLLTDINFKTGATGESAKKTVEAAITYLSSRPYVDRVHVGIQGHSFGGYLTNYIVTHSTMIAAAVSSCGISDITSDYGNVWPGDQSKQEYWETRRGGLATTPWDSPDIYVQNSPIYFAGNVKAPILMMANRNDKNVHFEQGLELFTALRRAGKRVWMLEYDKGGHGVIGKEEYKDFVFRMRQFFDHYLKCLPAPKWLINGIPFEKKGIDDGLELDSTTITPAIGGLLINYIKE
jgi:dipeptidyl aminopeptidase/acylaminoacyl peptidase